MKTRSCFVSNSSSSSFLIDKRAITKSQLSFLEKRYAKYDIDANEYLSEEDSIVCGMKCIGHSIKEQIFDNSFNENEIKIDVGCNQDAVIYDLLSKKIPFIATIHYEYYILLFDGAKIKFVPTLLDIFMYWGCGSVKCDNVIGRFTNRERKSRSLIKKSEKEYNDALKDKRSLKKLFFPK